MLGDMNLLGGMINVYSSVLWLHTLVLYSVNVLADYYLH